MAKSPKKTNAPAFSITLTISGKVYSGAGSTILEALLALQKPRKITNKATLIVSKGASKHERLLNIPQAKRLYYPLARQVIAKQLAIGLK